MNQKSIRVRERTRGKEQSYLNGIFAEATITGRNNQDCDSAAEFDKLTMTTMRMIVDDCIRIV